MIIKLLKKLKMLVIFVFFLEKLLKRICGVIEIIQETADASVLLPKTQNTNGYVDKFLSPEDHKNIKRKLQELLVSICDYCNERLAAIIGTHSDQRPLTSYQILELSQTIEIFTKFCEDISGKTLIFVNQDKY